MWEIYDISPDVGGLGQLPWLPSQLGTDAMVKVISLMVWHILLYLLFYTSSTPKPECVPKRTFCSRALKFAWHVVLLWVTQYTMGFDESLTVYFRQIFNFHSCYSGGILRTLGVQPGLVKFNKIIEKILYFGYQS